jgi:acyl transferase domain-containing protein
MHLKSLGVPGLSLVSLFYEDLSFMCLNLTEELFCDEKMSNINQAAYSQPICTVLQIALVDLLDHWNIKTVAVAGHSSGEIAAAYCKGSISRHSAWKISYERGRLTAKVTELAPHLEGGMLAVGLSENQALES